MVVVCAHTKGRLSTRDVQSRGEPQAGNTRLC
jgi:hypothetical protein